ncbi:hypothetical protein Tco_0513625 [Tanacetum coccineum]
MSSASSAVTYTSVYTDSEPGRVFWGADEEISDGGSPRVIVLGYDGLPIQPVAPPSPDYIPDSEEPQTPPVPQDEDEREPMFIQPHDPDYVPEPIYPEYIPLEDEHEFLAEEQPLPPVVSPTAESPGYVVESDPEEDPEEYEDDETEDGARKTVTLQASISLPPEAEVERLLALPTLPPSPPIFLSPPSAGERLARIASTLLLVDAVLPITIYTPLPPLPPSLYIPPPVDHKDDIPESERPPYKRSCLFALGPMYEVGESSTARPIGGRGIDYRFVSIVDAEAIRQGIREVGIVGLAYHSESHGPTQRSTYLWDRINLSRRRYLLWMRRPNLPERPWATSDKSEMQSIMSFRPTMTMCMHTRPRSRHIRNSYSCRAQIVETLRVIRDIRREMSDMQAELLALQEQRRRARQPAPDARVPDHQDASRDADSHI